MRQSVRPDLIRAMLNPSDHTTLVEQASRGEEPALEELLVLHLPRLEAFVRRHADQLALARDSLGDVVQSVCREALQLLARERFEYQGRGQFVCWLHRIAIGKLGYRRRANLVGKRDLRREEQAGTGYPSLAEVSAEYASPSQVAANKEDRAALAAAMEELPPDYQQVIFLSKIAGLSGDELAAEMGRSNAATRQLLSRAMGRLALQLGANRSGGEGFGPET